MKKLFLTGGSKGLGAELIKVFEPDYEVTNFSRTASAASETVEIDLSNLDMLNAKVSTIKHRFDLCILNAGKLGSINKAANIRYEDLEESLKLNVIANKIIIDKLMKVGCRYFVAISSGAATKNYDGWLEYCVSKAALRSLINQYQKEYQTVRFVLLSPGILATDMNKTIKEADISTFPDMRKFHETKAACPEKAAKLIYSSIEKYLGSSATEIDLRNEQGW